MTHRMRSRAAQTSCRIFLSIENTFSTYFDLFLRNAKKTLDLNMGVRCILVTYKEEAKFETNK